MKIVLIVVAIIVVVLGATQLVISARFTARIADLRRQVLAIPASTTPDQSLIPALVREFAARNGGRVGGPTAVGMRQLAEMRFDPNGAFLPLVATQLSSTRQAGFVWHASGTMARIVPLQVVDSYVAGSGRLEARLAGAVPVASASGPDIDRGEAMRFLAELAWNPDAMVNADGLVWRQVDPATVDVSMETTGGTATVSLRFDAAGDIVGIVAEQRPRAVGNISVPTPWVGRFSEYEQSGAYRYPRRGEIAWVLPEGEFVYWRGEILEVTPAGNP